MRCALYFYRVSWVQFEYVFVLSYGLQWPPHEQISVYPLLTCLVSTHRHGGMEDLA